MAFDTLRKNYSKENFKFIEIEVGGSTYRFCEDRSPIPVGLDAQPTLKSINISPSKIDLMGGLGYRGSISATIAESMDYTIWGTITNPVRFWSRWRIENPYYLGGRISYYSGYLEGDVYDIDNFVRRDYIIESFGQTAGSVSFSGKDPLKLADNKRSQAPVESNGSLLADITDTDLSLTLQPVDIGGLEYPLSGVARIGEEIVTFTRSDDVMTIVRGQFNTVADSHTEGDKVQLCLQYTSETPANIIYDLLTTYGNVPTSLINKTEWDAESASAFSTTYSTLITEPVGVTDLVREFAESAPTYQYWDETAGVIRFVALKPPPDTAQLLTYEGNLLADSVAIKDRQDLRLSTVIYHFGQFNPTKDLEEPSNYRRSHVRIDTASLSNYGQNSIKRVYSRWISSDNKTAAVLASARIGRRFSEAPREIRYALDAKDADVNLGDNVKIKTDLVEFVGGGGFDDLFYQVLSAQEGRNYQYMALEHTYGPAVDGDEDAEDPNVRIVFLAGEMNRLGDAPRSLREVYESVYGNGPVDPQLDVRFIFESSAVAGSDNVLSPSVRTGAWPELTTPILIDNRGLIVGKGGKGRDAPPTSDTAENGGLAIQLEADIRLDNSGIIGGGGGGGDGVVDGGTVISRAAGGGGAGFFNGAGGLGTFTASGTATIIPAQNGTNTAGGAGGYAANEDQPEPTEAQGYDGGNLGQNGGGPAGGVGGKAIDLDGFAITYINAGDIRGTVS